jgi:hypothetical protein
MKYIKMAFGFIVVAGLMAVMAGPALAEGVRSVGCIENKEKGQWEDSNCEIAKAKGNWETKEPTETKEVTSITMGKGVVLEDTGAKTEIFCTGTGSGSVGPGGKGRIASAVASKCEFESGKAGSCESGKPVTAKAIHLPWNTTYENPAGAEIRTKIENGGKGEPGYEVECTVAGIFKVTDTCEGATSTLTKNVPAENEGTGTGTVEAEFEATSAKANCSVGGKGTGRTGGTTLFRLRFPQRVRWWILRILF